MLLCLDAVNLNDAKLVNYPSHSVGPDAVEGVKVDLGGRLEGDENPPYILAVKFRDSS